MRQKKVTAVPRDGEQDQVRVIPLEGAVHMQEDEVLPWHCAPVAYVLFLNHIQGRGLRRRVSSR